MVSLRVPNTMLRKLLVEAELHGAAQYYYLTNLRLAAQAGNATGYAVTLCALSSQARLLGHHHRQAVDLAEAVTHTVAGATGAQTSVLLLGQLAVAHAAGGDPTEAIRHLSAAEHRLDRARDATEPIGGRDAASLAHQQAAVRAKLDDRAGAIQALTVSVHHRPADERRSRAITLVRLAEPQLDNGELEAACGTWQRFLHDCPHPSSRRVDHALTSMRARPRPPQNKLRGDRIAQKGIDTLTSTSAPGTTTSSHGRRDLRGRMHRRGR